MTFDNITRAILIIFALATYALAIYWRARWAESKANKPDPIPVTRVDKIPPPQPKLPHPRLGTPVENFFYGHSPEAYYYEDAANYWERIHELFLRKERDLFEAKVKQDHADLRITTNQARALLGYPKLDENSKEN